MTAVMPSGAARGGPRNLLAARWAMVGTLVLGFALRLHRLGAPSLGLDEMGRVSAAAGGLAYLVPGDSRRLLLGVAPLDHVLTWLALQVAQDEFVMRLPAALLGTLTLALVYGLGRMVFGQWTGVLAALLLAVAPLHLRSSQETGFTALLTCLAVVSTWALVRALRRTDGQRQAWALYALALAAALFTHVYAVFLVIAQTAVVLALPWLTAGLSQPAQTRRRFLGSVAVAGAVYAPWLFYAVLPAMSAPGVATFLPSEPNKSGSPTALLLSGWIAAAGGSELPTALLGLYLGMAIVGAAAGWARPRLRVPTALLALPVLLIPPLIVLLWPQPGADLAAPARRAVFLLPFVCLLVGMGAMTLAWLAGRAPVAVGTASRRQAAALLVLAGALVLPLWPAIDSVFTAPRQDWRNALAFVAANAGPEDAVLAPGVPGRYFGYYLPDTWQEIQDLDSAAAVQAAGQHAPAVWIVATPAAGDAAPEIRAALRAAGALLLDFGPDMAVYYWQPQRTLADVLATSLRWTPPHSPAALERLAYIYANANMPAAAASAARQAAALASTREAASRYEELRGSIWRRFDDAEQAIAAYRQAVALWPDNHEALVRLGEQLLARNRVDEAAAYLERALRLEPASYWAQRFLGEARARQGRLDEALPLLQAAIALQPDEPAPYFRLGDVLAAAGDSAGAIAAFERYLSLAPDGPKADEIRQRLQLLRQPAQ